nr:MAG TPA_asm: hypothetical protein [Caudoviricetes sp.]
MYRGYILENKFAYERSGEYLLALIYLKIKKYGSQKNPQKSVIFLLPFLFKRDMICTY